MIPYESMITEVEAVSEHLDIHSMWIYVIARDDFTAFSSRESIKSHTVQYQFRV
jgi:hypothetical protein